jgi:hypothetical protein
MPRVTCQQLLDEGDRATRDHDLETLARVALVLAPRVGDPLEARLLELARSCRAGAKLPLRTWPALRAAVVHRIEIAGT